MEQIITNNIGHSSRCYRVKCKNFTNWYTVHDLKEVKEILNTKEKAYLGNFIKPFKDKVEYIIKYKTFDDSKECLIIKVKDECSIQLPFFKAHKMYEGMEISKEYSVKELGLDN